MPDGRNRLPCSGARTPIRAVDLELVRPKYYATCVAEGDTADVKRKTREKRFHRAVINAQHLNLIGVRVEPSGRTLVWLATADADAYAEGHT